MNLLKLAPIGLLILGAAACSAQATASPAPVHKTPAAAAPATPAPVAAVPGTNNNKYVTGPFATTFIGLAPLPTQYDEVTESGKTIPETCAKIGVENTSANYTGWVAPTVEFVKGHTLKGQLLDTEAGDASGGSDGGESSNLAPGQSQVLYACPQNITRSTYVEVQLTSIAWGLPDQGTMNANVAQLKY